MGLFDSIANQAANALSGQGNAGTTTMFDTITALLANPEIGGISGLVDAFQQHGLGNIIASWVGDGENLPISGCQLLSVLGNAQMQRVARKLGLSVDEASDAVAGALPQVVDKLSPNGQMPDSDMLAQGLALLGRLGR
ncbi:hypothetical protein A9404_03520 [Halothiobacillus diazotrophicus]|uniref:DUF937 domain-containing protein n=1 Tax=Halothiobacillus diazotrophicus TaxID=1860122 RepID=A0A191ZFE3_9GAMM|nr:YidB family protein [Halothiobacillus diazotrophicus]ANJ66572.1 hypothetical protein A9404_03520 [Halothiobacillus diazotrophicus]